MIRYSFWSSSFKCDLLLKAQNFKIPFPNLGGGVRFQVAGRDEPDDQQTAIAQAVRSSAEWRCVEATAKLRFCEVFSLLDVLMQKKALIFCDR